MGKNQKEAVRVVRGIASRNRATTWLTEEILNEIGGEPETTKVFVSGVQGKIRNLPKSFVEKVTPLFETRKKGLNAVSGSSNFKAVYSPILIRTRVYYSLPGRVSEWDIPYLMPSSRNS